MPGHDKSRIVGLELDQLEEFVCGICQDVLNDPVVTQCCRQSYCRQCINEWLRRENTCPHDRSLITLDDLVEAPRFVVSFINKLRIKCELYENGCEIVVNIENYEEHRENCKYRHCEICECKDPGHGHVCLDYLIDENIKLKEELNECKSEIVTQKTEIKTLKTDIEVLSRKFREKFDLRINVDKNISELQGDKQVDSDLVEKLQLTRNSYDALESKYEEIEDENSILKERIQVLEQSYEILRAIKENKTEESNSENKPSSLHQMLLKYGNISVCIILSFI